MIPCRQREEKRGVGPWVSKGSQGKQAHNFYTFGSAINPVCTHAETRSRKASSSSSSSSSNVLTCSKYGACKPSAK